MKYLTVLFLSFTILSFTMPHESTNNTITILLDGLGEEITKASKDNNLSNFIIYVNAYKSIIYDYNIQGAHRERLKRLLENNSNFKEFVAISITSPPKLGIPGWTNSTRPFLLKMEEYNINLVDILELTLDNNRLNLQEHQIENLQELIKQQQNSNLDDF